ncbi:hypothetical protein PMAYCL1PPCAC_22356, partial [Pristionchus mayeri]
LAMHLFDLLHDVLRELMIMMSINDCMRLRRTCRTFEKLVANTHAVFDYGEIVVKEIQVDGKQENMDAHKKNLQRLNLAKPGSTSISQKSVMSISSDLCFAQFVLGNVQSE